MSDSSKCDPVNTQKVKYFGSEIGSLKKYYVDQSFSVNYCKVVTQVLVKI